MPASRTWHAAVARPWLLSLPLFLLLFLLLSACATDGAAVRAEKPVPTLERSLAEAGAALAAGQADQAQDMLKSAAGHYPADKAPWLQLAQLKFDRASYGEAITNALEALQRGPGDKLANSIVAVSGLRLSTRALADLSQQNNLNGPLRSEAQDLARLLRTSLGEEVLVPPPAAAPRKAAGPAPAKKPVAPPSRGGATDPFGGLK